MYCKTRNFHVWEIFEIFCSVENSYRPRLPVLGLGYLLHEPGSPGGRPQKSISQLLLALQRSITHQFAVRMIE